jgi:hypothetical protein
LMEAEPIRGWALLGKWSLLDKVRRPDGCPAFSTSVKSRHKRSGGRDRQL